MKFSADSSELAKLKYSAAQLAEKGQLLEAAAQLRAILETHPSEPGVWKELATLLGRAGLLSQAPNLTEQSWRDFASTLTPEVASEHVICLAPKGAPIALPHGATAIDFAYAIHTDIGNSAVECRINGQTAPLETRLTNGDLIHIVTSETQKAPPARWEETVVTSKARSAIRRACRIAVRAQYAMLGRRIVERLAQRAELQYSDEKLSAALTRLQRTSIEDVMSGVGRGEIRAADVIQAIFPDSIPAQSPRPSRVSLPNIPAQGAGPHFVLRDDGVVDFAPPEAIDQQGNNIAHLRALHPTLRDLVQELLESLSRGNLPHSSLRDRVESYYALIDQALDAIPFARLYVEGVRLENAARALDEKVKENELPSLEVPAREAIDSLLRLHSSFILSTADGLALLSAEERYERRPTEEQELRDATLTFAQQLKGRPDIIEPAAADFVLRAAEELGRGDHPERSAAVVVGTTKNAAIVVITGATIGALPLVGGVLGGVAGLVGGGLAALVGAEGLKKSRSFLAIAGMITKSLDHLSEADLQKVLAEKARSLTPYVAFVQKIDPILRRLTINRAQFAWLKSSLDWVKANVAPSGRPVSAMKREVDAQPAEKKRAPLVTQTTMSVPIRGLNADLPVHFAPKVGAVPGDRIVGILTPGEGITIYPIQSEELKKFEDVPESWLDLRWDVDERSPQRFPARIVVQALNEPGALATVAQTVAVADGNIDNINMRRQTPDATIFTIDVEVFDLGQLRLIIDALRNEPVVLSTERFTGSYSDWPGENARNEVDGR